MMIDIKFRIDYVTSSRHIIQPKSRMLKQVLVKDYEEYKCVMRSNGRYRQATTENLKQTGANNNSNINNAKTVLQSICNLIQQSAV